MSASTNAKSKPSLPKEEWSLTNLPPEGHEDVGPYFFQLFENARRERERLGLPERWLENHRLFRGLHWGSQRLKKDDFKKVTVNLFFANVVRTVANITAKEPQAEVVEIMGEDAPFVPGSMGRSDLTKTLTMKMRTWYNESEQGEILYNSATNMEVYGITVEKFVWNADEERAEPIVVDPFSFFPAPGYYDYLNDCPYLSQAYAMRCDSVEKTYGVDGVETDDVYSVLGEEREENRPYVSGTRVGSANYPSNYSATSHPASPTREYREQRCLVIEIWIRDRTIETVEQIEIDEVTGEEVYLQITGPKYPGGIRKVCITNNGNLVLDDVPNPSINPALSREAAMASYLYDHFPFYKANSYKDSSSIWGFSSAEQVADLNLKIDELVSRMAGYLGRVMLPVLIMPKDTGISLDKLSNRPGLVLQPTNMAVAQGIRYLQPPNLPSNFMDLLTVYTNFFDRVSQIEDADRGEASGGVIAASAIVALQERGAVLMRAKIRSVDALVRERGRCAISLYQNFGLMSETFEIEDQPISIKGVDLAGRRFNYVIESGSTVHRTSAQIQEQAQALYQTGAIDRQAILEAINFPRWKEIIERVADGQLGQALQILQQAGMDEEMANQLYQELSQPQTAKAKTGKAGAPAQPGVPQAQQGEIKTGSHKEQPE